MRVLALLLLAAGCRVSEPAPPVDPPPDPAALAAAPLPAHPVPEADAVTLDTMALGPYGSPLAPDTLVALAAAVDQSVTGSVALIGRTGVYHEGEVAASAGERWQGLYPVAGGVDLRSFAIGIETAKDEVIDPDDGPFTGVRVSTPWSSEADGYGYSEDAAIAFVRRDRPFPEGAVPTAFVGAWPVTTGYLSLALGNRSYRLSVVAGPESWWSPVQRTRNDRVLVLIADGVRQPISAIVGGDAGQPSLLWAGDLDGDGALDLLIDETNHYNLSAPALFLSSAARPGELVRRVARHESVGC